MELALTPSQLLEEMPHFHAAGLVPFLLASPGNAKSQLCRQYADAIRMPYVVTHLGYKEPQDVIGWPSQRNGEMVFLTPSDYPKVASVWNFDELTQVPREVQSPVFELMLDKRIGAYRVPPGSLLCATGNLLADKAHVERIASALINRMVVVRLHVPVSDWITWAKTHDIDPRVYTFIRFAPHHLSDFNAAKWDGQSAFSSLRSWEMVSNYVKATGGVVRGSTATVLAGMVSKAAALECTQFLQVFSRIPTIEGILLDPYGVKIPEKLDEKLAVCASIAGNANEKNFKRFLPFIERLEKEFEVFTVKAARARCPEIQATEAYILWMDRNTDVVLNS